MSGLYRSFPTFVRDYTIITMFPIKSIKSIMPLPLLGSVAAGWSPNYAVLVYDSVGTFKNYILPFFLLLWKNYNVLQRGFCYFLNFLNGSIQSIFLLSLSFPFSLSLSIYFNLIFLPLFHSFSPSLALSFALPLVIYYSFS
jgi:hypothetical protein